MLVLTRRLNEEIVIAGNIRITVLECNGRHVRLGIAAPSTVTVDRQEVHERRLAADFSLLQAPVGHDENEVMLVPQGADGRAQCRRRRSSLIGRRIPR